MKSLSVISFLILSIVTANAQQTSYSLAECIELTLQNSYLVQSVDALKQSAEQKVKETHTDYYPLIYGELSHNQLFYSQGNYAQQNISAVFDWSLGSLISKTALADAKKVEVLKSRTKQTALEAVRRTANIYLGILKNRQEQRLVEERLRVIKKHLQVVEAMWHGGVRTEFDVLQTKSAINILQEQGVRLKMEIDVLQSALTKLMNLAEDSNFTLLNFPQGIIELTPDFSGDNIIFNPKVQALGLQVEQQLLKINSIRASNLPHITALTGYFFDADPYAEGNYWQAGIGLSLPLYRWGKTAYQKQQLQIASQALKYKNQEVKRDLSIRQKQIKKRIENLKNIYTIQRERENLSRRAVEIATANYQAGLITNLEYLNAEKVNVIAKIALNETRLAYVQQLIENYLIGNQIEKIKQLQDIQ
jgi:outer membrane protein TolC